MALNPFTAKLEGHRNNIKIALVIGVVAMILNVFTGFFIDTFFWLFSIIQAYRWYTLSEKYIQEQNPLLLDKLKSYKNSYLVLWIVAAAMSVLFWGLQLDSLLGVIVSGIATYQMNQFEADAAGGSMTNQTMNTRFHSSDFDRPVAQTQQAPVQNEESVFCGQCGTRQNGSPKFCSNCGAQIIG